MGQTVSITHASRVPRKFGEKLNVFNLPMEHVKVLMPPSEPSTRISVCRCWRSAKFPICDNSHQLLRDQGINVGPVMFEARKAQ
ncbi:CDGSH iron-sulfur domain-containing protein, putative [Babesia caballi]|uniref:CDGSH iron-sulfur domain-containing protein, putative n=1 Tax=Babesia caballi TaxID=5871 RepID=A0AAV4LXE4_BABCB|nr:CDGSH iron-sulfur domain-containing protein, putative [Babesia caballi]